MRTHYPRTPHLPWSPGAASDDVRVADLTGLAGREVVVTEKLDGENTTLYADGLHARSLDSAHHPSRAWVKALHGRIRRGIPAGWRVCGENMYALHSLAYDDLESWFYGFSVWDGEGRCLDWDRTVAYLRGLGVPVPRVLWRGNLDRQGERALRALAVDPARQEGYVVRTAEGFRQEEFGRRVAKWVRTGHVQTDTHWMHATVVANGLSPAAELWSVRSGAAADVAALSAAVGLRTGEVAADESTAAVVAGVCARLDGLGRSGDARLAGVLAALLHRTRGTWPAPRLAGVLGLPTARRVADLITLHRGLHRPYPDEERRAGLVRMSYAADLGVLHAVAGAVAESTEAREQTEWSALHAEEAGLLGEDPLGPLRDGVRTGLRAALGELDGDVADRCWAQARQAYALGRITTPEEAVAATWKWRSGDFPRLIQLVGPSGSGKSTFARGLEGIGGYVSLDELRQARGSRADQKANSEVLRAGLDQLDAALARSAAAGGTVVWDATSLNPHQRSLVHAVAHRRDALITHAVALVDEDELVRRNAVRTHPVPTQVLTAQLHRFVAPYPGEAHRTWYIGASGTVEEEA